MTTAVVGSTIAVDDVIQTSANGGMQVNFADNTTLILSINTQIKVDQYVYDPTTEQGSSLFSVLQGACQYVSGLIGKHDPGAENIDSPVGEIGIRGTQFVLQVTPDQDQIDLIQGEVALTPTLTGVTTIVDAPETTTFNSSSLIGTAPLTESGYDLLQTQLFPALPFEISTTSLTHATPGTPYGPVTLLTTSPDASTSPFVTTLKWKKVTLPKGLKLSSGGMLSGTPNAKLAAPSSVTVQVTETVITLNGKKKVKTKTTVQATLPIRLSHYLRRDLRRVGQGAPLVPVEGG